MFDIMWLGLIGCFVRFALHCAFAFGYLLFAGLRFVGGFCLLRGYIMFGYCYWS